MSPNEEQFRFHIAQTREIGAHPRGCRLYQTMLVWETDPSLRDDELGAAFADVWCALPKVVFSRSLDSVQGNARLAKASVAEEAVAALDATDKDVAIGGAGLAAQAIELGLIDELRMFRYPIVVGGSTPFLPPVTEDVPMDLIETRTFGSRVIYERCNATVGGIRDARTAGIRPANAPIRMAEAMPPDHASTGITTAQPFELAYTAVAAAPASTPTTPPMTASRIDSARNCVRIWPFVAPRARRRPISERRSSTEMIMMLATPTAPTISATTPSPRKRLSNAPAAAARAVSTSDGWLTFTSFGASGLAVRASSDCTAAS